MGGRYRGEAGPHRGEFGPPRRADTNGAASQLARVARKGLWTVEEALHGLLRLSREVHKAALQERRDAYRLAGKTIRWQEQFNQIKHLKGVRDDALVYGIQPLRGAINASR